MQGVGLFLYGTGLLLIGIVFLVRAESIVAKFFPAILEANLPGAISVIRIIGLLSLFMFIVLLCGIWANS